MDGAQTGSRFDVFYRDYSGRVRALAARRFGENGADDIAQEVMLRAHHHFDRLSETGNVWPWLVVVTRNVGVNQLRATRRSVPMDLGELDDMVPSADDGPAVAAVAGDTRRRLGRAMARLTEKDRRTLQLREIDGLPIVEIAARHGASAGAVRQRLFRARQVLAREYQALGGERLIVPALPRISQLRVGLVETAAGLPGSLQEGAVAAVTAIAALLLTHLGTPVTGTVPPPAQSARVDTLPPRTSVTVPALPDIPRLSVGLVPPFGTGLAGCPRYLHVAAGYDFSLAVRTDGTVWTWGHNGDGQLGDGTTTTREAPVQVRGLADVATVAAGYSHSLAVKRDGTVWAWGGSDLGQLGDGTTGSRIPVPVPGLSDARAVTAGEHHSLVVKSDGTVWAWGLNVHGQLGNGTTANGYHPVQVAGLDGVTAIAAGGDHSLALRRDGTVLAWGMNLQGQLGDGTIADSSLPVHVAGLDGVIAIAGGENHSLALRDDGTVWAWGSNEYGGLGDGAISNRPQPALIPGLAGVTTIAASRHNSMAMKRDGTVRAWGLPYDNPEQRAVSLLTTPEQIMGLGEVRMIAPGYYHSLAVERDGTVRQWGSSVAIGRLDCGQAELPRLPSQTVCVVRPDGPLSDRCADRSVGNKPGDPGTRSIPGDRIGPIL